VLTVVALAKFTGTHIVGAVVHLLARA